MTSRLLRRLSVPALAACATATVMFPAVASAHAVLDSSSPAASQELSSSPEVIRLDFSEAVETNFSRIQLFDSDEKEVSLGTVVQRPGDDSVISSKVPTLANGVYVVVWRVVSVDGHPVSGAFPFSVGTGAIMGGSALVNRILEGDRPDGLMRWVLSVARFLGFLGAIVLVGHLWLTWRTKDQWSGHSETLMKQATTCLAIGSVGVVLLQGPLAVGGSWSDVFDVTLIGDVMSTRLGVAALARLTCVVAWGALVLVSSRVRSLAWRMCAVSVSGVTLLSFAVSGHPSAEQNAVLFVGVDLVHLVSVSAWVGGVISLWSLRRDDDADLLAGRFSRQATLSMPVVVVTGVIQSLHLSNGVSSLFHTGHGRVLLVKVAVALGAIGLGAGGRRRLRVSGVDGLARVLKWESWSVVVVLALTSVLVGLSPNPVSPSVQGSFSVTLVQGGVLADVTVTPTSVGTVEVHALLSPPGGSLEPTESMTVSMSLPGRDIPAIPVEMTSVGTNHFSGVVQIPYAGTWTLEARVVPEANVTLLYSTQVKISD